MIGDYLLLGKLIDSMNETFLAKKGKQLYAIKQIDGFHMESLEYKMKMLDHPNLMKMEYIRCDDHSYAASKLGDYDLFSLVESQKDLKLNYTDIINIINQIVDAVAYLHEHNLVHRDIKLENFVLIDRRPKNLNVKLIDFDFLLNLNEQCSYVFYGTEGYRPPESGMSLNPDWFKVDSYQLGVTIKKIIKYTIGVRSLSSYQRRMIQRLVETDPNQRISVIKFRDNGVFLEFVEQEEYNCHISLDQMNENIQKIRERTYPIFMNKDLFG